jgi:MFS transporter, VNT family, synaptic vesicle glycoprotein 2
MYTLISLVLPTFAVFTINQEWSFHFELLSLNFKPWRLFLIICGLPSLVCALVLIFVLPESPKFTFAQGNEEETLKIFAKIHRMNFGKSSQSFQVKGIVKDAEFTEVLVKSDNFFKFMWNQSVPLFQGKHLRNMLTACYIQFAACNACNGFWTFLPEIMNKITLWTKSEFSENSATLCEIFSAMDVTKDETNSIQCVTKLELATFAYVFFMDAIFGISYFVLSLIINYTGKLIVLEFILISCGVSALAIMFVEIPVMSAILYILIICSGLAISVVNASTAELFPTKMRFEFFFYYKFVPLFF